MVMFQATAMLQEAAPVAPAAPKSAGVRGASEKTGGFKQVLQDRQQQDGANETAKGEASKADRSATANGHRRDAAVSSKGHERAAKRQLDQVADATPPEEKDVAGKATDAGLPQKEMAKAEAEGGKASSADAAGEEETVTPAAVVEPKVILPLPGILNGNLNLEGKTISVAEQGAAAVQAAGERAADATRVSLEETGGKEIPAADTLVQPAGTAGTGTAAKGVEEILKQAAQQVAPPLSGTVGQELSKAGSGTEEQKKGDVAAQPATEKTADNAAGKTIPFTRMRSGIFYEAPVKGAPKDEAAVGAEAKVTQQGEQQPQQAPTPVMGEEAPAVTRQDLAQQAGRQAAAAPEAAHKEAKAPAANTEAPQQQNNVQTTQTAQTGQTAQTAQEQNGAVAAQGKDVRPVESHGRHAFDKVRQEEPGQAQNPAVEDAAGAKTASATDGSKVAATPKQPGQEGSGDAAGKGHQEQNAHMKQGVELAGAAANQAQGVDTAPVEGKQAGQRTPLHESILSQVKEGVVTHDGKGNGQVSIRLNPGELGELKIQVRMEDNRLRVEVQADNRMVKDLLMSNLDSLKEALSGKNFTMDGFNVSTGGSSGFNSALGEHKEGAQQQSTLRSARSGYGESGRSEGRVKYLTAEVNNLLDVRF